MQRLSHRSLACALVVRAAPLVALITLVAVPASLAAQATATGRVVGVITDENHAPVQGAQVSLTGTRLGALSGLDGRYVIGGVPAGTYEVRVQRIGQRPRSVPNVVVRAGEATAADASLEAAAASLGGVVVSASRRVEKITDAPATISSIGTETLDQSVGNTFAGALKEAKGVDFIQVGMTAIAINARGFNSSFNNRFLMVEDGRISVLPENGLPVGSFTPTPKVDLAGLEVLVGPGSALYGPDASNGVLSLRTKDPRQYKGATLEITGGNRSYADIQGRYANTTSSGALGFKVAGEYQTANDWANYLCYTAGGAVSFAAGQKPTCATGLVREDNLKTPIDWKAKVARGTGAVVWYDGENRLEVNAGMSVTDGVGQTNVGRNQLSGWKYNVAQARYTTPHWYLNAYRAQSQSGKSFALNRYAGAQLTPATASLSPDSLRMLSDWPSDGRMYAGEAQGNYVVAPLRNTAVVFGAQYRDDVVSSDRQWLTDRITGSDISNDQKGVYAQTTTPVMPWLDVVLAGRYDKPSVYHAQWSPKAGVVVKPIADQALRVTFNRAFKSPTILQTNFFIPDWTSIISIYGNTTGFKTVNAAGNTVSTYGAMVPETNKTWEFGYKGVLAQRLYLDATYFRSDYQNFMSPLTIVGNPFAAGGAATWAVPTENPGNHIPVNAQGRIVNQANISPIVLIYYNLGNAKVSGTDIGANFVATPHVELRGTVSTVKIDELTTPSGASPEATSLNSPTTKWTFGGTARDVGPLTFGATWRNVNAYYFRSGSNQGVVPTFGTLDASVSLKLSTLQNTMLNLGVSNLLSCTAQDVTYVPASKLPTGAQPNSIIDQEDRSCGFNRRHVEMINMPEIGPIAFLGVRFQR
ncbi:TonB-dependent receptor plug [Gemmatirosa kalamazoonensis]|uniref:TonB-dependent receptor plug n=1 Tax=Gemmatirosa kalamazoonensis TaxID=861299 RepID=W0RLS6_9BACT|nr:TonB-dependent receptor [Gemmatirosa kalamazoonensis]AHG91265.1 TonB-dependent receptor plug [Gemmatirosa kalamazoonensis]